MKTLIKLLLALCIATGAAVACYDDSSIKSDIEDLQVRMRTMEAQMLKANDNIFTLQSLVDALNGKVSISSVTETSDGWTIKFSDGTTATITNGTSPKIGVKKGSDGVYYWTLNGDWLLGSDGEKLPVVGQDGAPGTPGEPGTPGKDAISPQLKIEGDYWYISTDGGSTWTQAGKATGEDGDSMFKSVSSDESFWYFVLTNGDIIKIGRGIHGAKAITVIPSRSDGSVNADKGKFSISFDVLPPEAAEGLAGESNDIFNVKVVYTTLTKASNSISLPILSKEGKEGTLLITVDGSSLDKSFFEGTSGASACLNIVLDDNVMTSGYFPLYYDVYGGYDYVDLGLPSGVIWATCNVGAAKPEDYGDYFGWGETEPKSNYSWSTYKWCNGDFNKFTKYCTQSSYWDSAEPMDNKSVLDAEDDAASVNWGGSWRMPTDEEWTELRTKCTWTWTTQNGVGGRLVTGPNGNSIFLPAAGYRRDTNLSDAGSWGNYWSSSLKSGNPYGAYGVSFYSDNVDRVNDLRYDGLSVRPVTE